MMRWLRRNQPRLSIRVLRVGPDDTLIVGVPDSISHENARQILERIKQAFGDEQKALVMDSGMTLDVVHRIEVPKRGGEGA